VLRLGDHFRQAKPTRAIFTTFALSPSLFDSHIARRLLEGGCEEILLLTDRAGYEALLAERGAVSYAGCSYWVCPVDVAPSVFHPKVAVMWSKDEARLYVMSANLTHGGLWRNAEIVDRLMWKRNEGGPDTEIRKAAEWLERLPTVLDMPVAIRNPLERMTSELKSLFPHSGKKRATFAGQFIHNLDEPLLPQMLRFVSGEVEEVIVAAPFYSPGLTPIVSIGETFPKAKITVAQATKTGTINPGVSKAIRRRVTVATCRLFGPNRPWHAKFFLVKARDQWVFASGSPNVTSAALLKTAGAGNIEAATVRVGTRDALADLLASVKLTPVDWDDLTYQPIPSQSEPGAGPTLRWAEIANLRLRLEIDGVSAGDLGGVRRLSLQLRTGLLNDLTFKVVRSDSSVAVEAILPREIDAEMGASIFVSVEARPKPGSAYVPLNALVICPSEIAAPVALRRFRAALRAIQRNEMQTDDVREVLGFLRDNLSGLLLNLGNQPGFRGAAKRKTPPNFDSDRPAVTFPEDVESSPLGGFSIGGPELDLVGELPAIFRTLLHGPQGSLGPNQSATKESDDDSDTGDDEDEESADAPEYDADALSDDVRGFLDWANEACEAGSTSGEDAVRQWTVRAQLIEFALVFARFFYLRGEPAIDLQSPKDREYSNRVTGLLSSAFSASGIAWNQPAGWFVRAKSPDLQSTLLLPATLVAQVLFHVHEILSSDPARPGMHRIASPVLEGLELVSGPAFSVSDEIVAALGAVTAAYKLPDSRVAEIFEVTRTVRKVETPEQQALAKFRLLLSLQDAVGAARRTQGPPEAMTTNPISDLKQRCQALYPDETAQYFGLVAKGKWNNFCPVRSLGSSGCPRCNMGLPLRLAADLKNVLKVTPCPYCHALIIPIPVGPSVGSR
jgi:hypothetical protein